MFFPFPPLENDREWSYQLLPIKYELKLPSEVMPSLLGDLDPDQSSVYQRPRGEGAHGADVWPRAVTLKP